MINIAVLYGGTSVEHEVSVITAMQAIAVLKKIEGYHVVPIYVAKDGAWYTGEHFDDVEQYRNIPKLLTSGTSVQLIAGERPRTASLVMALTQPQWNSTESMRVKKPKFQTTRIDMVFPIIHGTGGEDGTLQGMLELLDLPYIGCNPLAASTTMDKVTTNALLKTYGIRQMPGRWFYSEDGISEVVADCEANLTYPLIVKPADVGSSVGVKTAHNTEELREAFAFASQFSSKVLIENKLTDMYEVNISVLGEHSNIALSVCERPLTGSEFLTYEDKYMSSESSKGMYSAKREIPADIPDSLRDEIQEIARKAFKLLDCSGVIRIDFLVDKATLTPYLCELNTVPGSLSFYLWEATGVSFDELIKQLIRIAHTNYRRKKRIIRSTDSNLLNKKGLLGVKK